MRPRKNNHANDAGGALADWYVRLSAPGAGERDRAAFQAWLAQSPEHRNLHATLAGGLAALDAAAADPVLYDERLAGMIEQGRVGRASPEEGPEECGESVTFWHRPMARRAAAALAAGIVGAFVAGVAWWQLTAPRYTAVATAVGEIREVRLADGSTIYANTDTRLAYAVTDRRRLVRLDRGEAYFQVAKNPARPFVVTVGKHEITVTGTAFNVKYLDGAAELVVAEGATLLSEFAGAGGVGVPKGTRATFANDRPVALARQADVAAAGSWRTGTLIYRDKPLAEIIADLGRYLPSRLAMASDGDAALVAQRRFTVLLQVADEAVMLDRIRLLLPVTLQEVRPGLYEVHVK